MTLREAIELGAEVCGTALLAVSITCIIIVYLLLTGNMP